MNDTSEPITYYTAPGSTTSATDVPLTPEVMITIFIVVFIFSLIAYIITSIFRQKLFKKASVEGWKAWVPFYNEYIMLQLGGQNGWWLFFSFFPPTALLTAVFMYIADLHIQRKLGKSDVWLVLAILFYPVWLGILAFDKSTWDDTKGAKRLDTQDKNQPMPATGQPAAPITSAQPPIEPAMPFDQQVSQQVPTAQDIPATPEAPTAQTNDSQSTPPADNRL